MLDVTGCVLTGAARCVLSVTVQLAGPGKCEREGTGDDPLVGLD